MLVSMTGYGRAGVTVGSISATADIRALNSRYLEVQLFVPRALSAREQDIKEIIRAAMDRGRITVHISVAWANATGVLMLDTAAAKAIYNSLNALREEMQIRSEVKLSDVLRFSDVMKPAESEEASEDEWNAVKAALAQGLESMNAMRRREGEQLGNDFRARIAGLKTLTGTVERQSGAQVARKRDKLVERIAALLGTADVDPQRIAMEVALLADRLDITEECVRLRSHIKFFDELMESKEPAGRKLNFLTQEMNREINTLGSKSDDPEIARAVVTMKEELEKIREQLQNIE